MGPTDSRPSPDELLERIKAEEEPKKRGALKIFLGYAAGVGKTYTMLEAAQQRKKELDVVVAYVETHGRTETEALLEGLEVIPRKQSEYEGLTLSEMDLDAVLRRRPRLALVDELAHTNVPDSRHLKRYQDVDELLEAGIDVYTTLNIQHIERLQDVVAQVTGVWIRETVPDVFIDNAGEIEIVDLPPEELLKRLKEGKVYVPDQIAQATANFFRKGNLTALRELTMRTAAKHVDKQKQAYMGTHAIRGPWPTSERLLVCISLSPTGSALVRATGRLARQLGAEWFAVHVETPTRISLSSDREDRLMDTLRLAERMGAKTARIQGNSVAEAVIEFARQNRVTKIVLGKPRRRLWRNLFGASIENQIIRQSAQSDIFIVNDTGEKARVDRAPEREWRNWLGYLWGLGLVALVTLLGQGAHGLFSLAATAMLYLLSVAVAAIFWGFGPSIAVSILSVIAFEFFFLNPFESVVNAAYFFTLATLLVISIIFSYLASQTRQRTETARRRERETAALYALSRDLAVSNDLESYVDTIIRRTRETFGRGVSIFLPNPQNRAVLKLYAKSSDIGIDEKELAAALWCFQHEKMAGKGTDTLPGAKARYLPLVTARGTIGVIGTWSTDAESRLTIEQERLLGAYTDLEALAIEGILMAEEANKTKILRTTEALQTALLNSISHGLRTPLISIINALNSLREGGVNLDDTTKRDVIQAASDEAETLSHLITNLIDMSRIDAGAVKILRHPSKVPEIIAAALEQLRSESESRQVKIDLSPSLPIIWVDFGLIVQTLVNILDNAFKYSPHDAPVEISARQVGQEIEIDVADRGIGIPELDLVRVFDKFYRVQRPDNVVGTGLGLSICKGFVEAHGGRIRAENRPGGGTIIKVTLPIGTDINQEQARA
ncbi:MAG: sensor histidine kinase KdpD [Chloroflexota bacterium]|nr:sensor histidine kinase KdpD [Chloroflexota bacterium]